MATLVLSFSAVVLIAAFFGIHLFGQLALNEALRTLNASIYIPTKQALDLAAPRVARPMMLSCLTTSGATLVTAFAASSVSVPVAVAAAIAFSALTATLLAIVRGDLPINRLMADWSADEAPEGRRTAQTRWAWLFLLRTVATGVALIAMGSAVLISMFELP